MFSFSPDKLLNVSHIGGYTVFHMSIEDGWKEEGPLKRLGRWFDSWHLIPLRCFWSQRQRLVHASAPFKLTSCQ